MLSISQQHLKYQGNNTLKINSEDWEIMHMKYPRAEKEANYMEELCDFWDSLNYYVEIKKQPSHSKFNHNFFPLFSSNVRKMIKM